ncbi:hypothetical protein Tco_1025913 [Tanacetum coccineum]
MSSGDPFGYVRRHVPPVSCDQLLSDSMILNLFWRFILLPSSAFRPSIVYSFDLPFFLHHMSSGSQTVGDAVVPKFDMHVYTSVLTSNEVKNLDAEYAIPLDLHPCVPPSSLTMNRLPVDKIVATSMSQFLKFSMAGGVRVGKGTALAANEKVVEYENERFLAAKRKAQEAKDRAVGKRAATEGASNRPKKKKTTPLSFALSDSEVDGSNQSVNRTEEDTGHHLDNVEDTTKVNYPLSGHSPRSQHSTPSDEDTQVRSGGDKLHHNVRDELAHTHTSGSTNEYLTMLFPFFSLSLQFVLSSFVSGHGVSSSSIGSHRQAFLRRNPGGDGVGSSLRGDVGLPVPFVPGWNLTTHSILNDAESCRDMMINLATPAVRDQQNRLSDYQALQRSWFELGRGALAQIDILQRYEAHNEDYEELYESHRSCQDVSDRLTKTQNQLVDTIRSRNKLSDDYKALQQVHLGCVRKEADLTDKLAAVEKEMDDLLIKTKRGRNESSTAPHCLSKASSLSDVFNLAIAAGWSEGVKAVCSEEEVEAFLATTVDYDPECKTTFMSEFDF